MWAVKADSHNIQMCPVGYVNGQFSGVSFIPRLHSSHVPPALTLNILSDHGYSISKITGDIWRLFH